MRASKSHKLTLFWRLYFINRKCKTPFNKYTQKDVSSHWSSSCSSLGLKDSIPVQSFRSSCRFGGLWDGREEGLHLHPELGQLKETRSSVSFSSWPRCLSVKLHKRILTVISFQDKRTALRGERFWDTERLAAPWLATSSLTDGDCDDVCFNFTYAVNSQNFPHGETQQTDSTPWQQRPPAQSSESQRGTALRSCRGCQDTLQGKSTHDWRAASTANFTCFSNRHGVNRTSGFRLAY